MERQWPIPKNPDSNGDLPCPASPYLASLSHCSFPPFLFPHYFLTGRGLPTPYPSPLILPHPTRPCPDPIGPRIPDGATRFLSENVANYVALFSAKCAQLCCTFRGQLPYPAAHQGATPWVQSGVGGTAKRKQFPGPQRTLQKLTNVAKTVPCVQPEGGGSGHPTGKYPFTT